MNKRGALSTLQIVILISGSIAISYAIGREVGVVKGNIRIYFITYFL